MPYPNLQTLIGQKRCAQAYDAQLPYAGRGASVEPEDGEEGKNKADGESQSDMEEQEEQNE